MSRYLITLLLITCWPFNDISAQTTVLVGAHQYPPYQDARGKGLFSDTVRAAFQAVGIEVQIQPLPIRRGLLNLANHEIDAMVAGTLFASPKELKQLVSSPVINVLPSWFFYLPHFNEPELIESLEDLKGYRVGVIVNSPFLEFYARHGLDITEIQTPEQLLLMAKKGRIDFFESTLLTGLHLIQQLMPADQQQFDYIRWDILEADLSFHDTNPNTPQLKQQFELGLEKLRQNGTLLHILESYWGQGNVPQAVFIHQYPAQGTESPTADKYWSYRRNSSGKINSPASPD